MRKLLAIILTLSVTFTYAQVYWATQVDTVTSQYSQTIASAQQVLGLPNADPYGSWSNSAWAVQPNEIGKEGVAWAFIDVIFAKTITDARQIAVFQNFNPGAISLILVSYDGRIYDIVYADTAVIERTGLPQFDGMPADAKLQQIAGKKQRKKIKLKFWKADKRFKPVKAYDVLHIFFDQPRVIKNVRVVINTQAIDGWNQIDAIGVSSDTIPIKFPLPPQIGDGLVISDRRTSLGYALNSNTFETAPRISPNGILYYSKKEYLKDLHFFTQNIYYGVIDSLIDRGCLFRKRVHPDTTQYWLSVGHTPWPFNNPLPNAVAGFSADGQYIFLANLYPEKITKDLKSLIDRGYGGVSVSHLDTTLFEKLDSATLFGKMHLDTVLYPQIAENYFYKDKNLLFVIDTGYRAIFMLSYDKKHKQWFKPQKIAPFKPGKYYLTYDNRPLWLVVRPDDSLHQVSEIHWAKPRNMVIDHFVNKSNLIGYTVWMPDSVMILAIDDGHSHGQRDLYISFYNKATGKWTPPQNLDFPLNSIGDESSPFLDGDGRTLYFASNGHPGFGGYDIFVSFRLDDTWLHWSKPLNLGRVVNTWGNELNFAISAADRNAYFVSDIQTANCRRQSDIYTVKMAQPVTIHLHGTTRNYTAGGIYYPNVDVSLISVRGDTVYPDKFIKLRSNDWGKYDVTIHRFVDASRMHDLALIARKDDKQQCDENGKPIPFLKLDIRPGQWNYDIDQDLYLLGEKPSGPLQPEIAQQKPVDTTRKKEETPPPAPKQKPPQLEVLVVGKMLIDTIGCPVVYHRGILYGFMHTGDEKEPFIIKRLDSVYYKEFDYNQTDISINEERFRNLLRVLDTALAMYHNVNVYILASASKVPTSYCSNFELARLRAQEPEKRIIQYLKEKGIDPSRVFFDKRYIVEGPEYEGDPENFYKYRPYQFVKIWIYSCEPAFK